MDLDNKRFPALYYRDYRLHLAGQLISNTGTQMQIVALNWHIYLLTHSAAALGIIGLVRFVPIFIFSIVGGSVADVHNRKKILYIAQAAMMLFSAVLALVTFTGQVNPAWIYITTALTCIAIAFDNPARQAFVPSLLHRKHFPNAISIGSVTWQLTTIMGPMIAGILLGKFPIWVIYVINTLSFLAVVVSLLLMHASGDVVRNTTEKAKVSLQSMLGGFRFIKTKQIIWSTMLLDFFCSFFASATSLLPIYAKDILHVGAEGLGFLYAAPSIGAVIAGTVMSQISELRRQGKILLLATVFYALGTIVFGVSTSFILSLLALGLVGAGDSVGMIIRNTIRQLGTPDNVRGRMTAIGMIFAIGGPQLGEFESGLLAAAVGGPLSVVVGGVGTLLVVGTVAARVPMLRLFDKHDLHTNEKTS
jgi:MFS family permease